MADKYVSKVNLDNEDIYIKDEEQRINCDLYRANLQAQIDSLRSEVGDLYYFVVDKYYTIPTVPAQSGTLTYTGSSQSPTWDGYDSDMLTISGSTSGTNAGTYTVTFTPKGEYHWSDGTQSAVTVTWTIGKATITTVPSQSGSLYANGSVQSPTWSNYNSSQLTIGGTTSASAAGTYTATFTPTSNYQWSDGTTTAKSVTWTIQQELISTVPSQSGTLTYTGSSQSPTWSNYDSSQLTIGGTTSATDAGTYTATFTPKTGYAWSDGTTSAKSVTWTIGRATISTTPSQSGSLTYTGSSQSPTWSNYDSSKMTISGTTNGTNAGDYTVTFTPLSNYQWSDGSTSSKSVTWTIGRATISTTPSQSGSLTYTGSSQSPTWSNYNSSQLTLSGTTSGTNAGDYTATFTPLSNYQWSDGSTTAKSVTWTIGRATISTVPSQSGSLIYTGSTQSPTWYNYDSSQLTIGGTTSATNAGTYTATFTPTSNYQWSDGTTTAKSVTWTIEESKKTPILTVTSTSLEVAVGKTVSVSYVYYGDGSIANIWYNSSNISATQENHVASSNEQFGYIFVTGVSVGTSTIFLTAYEGTEYESIQVQIHVTVVED